LLAKTQPGAAVSTLSMLMLLSMQQTGVEGVQIRAVPMIAAVNWVTWKPPWLTVWPATLYWVNDFFKPCWPRYQR